MQFPSHLHFTLPDHVAVYIHIEGSNSSSPICQLHIISLCNFVHFKRYQFLTEFKGRDNLLDLDPLHCLIIVERPLLSSQSSIGLHDEIKRPLGCVWLHVEKKNSEFKI